MKKKDDIILENAYKLVRLLLETPEVVNNKYDRNNYEFEYFLGDDRGVLICKYVPTIESHAFFLKKLKVQKVIDDNFNIIYPDVIKEVDCVLGKPTTVDFNFSGIILPKQRDVDCTYISFWTKIAFESNNRLLPRLLFEYASKRFQEPYAYEITRTKGDKIHSKVINIKHK